MNRPDRWKTPLAPPIALLSQGEMVARIEAARIGQPYGHRCPHCGGALAVHVSARGAP